MPPVATVRGTPGPSAKKMPDGATSKITFANNVNIIFWETGIKPPGIDNGDPIPMTSLFNQFAHTQLPRKLNKYTDGSVKVQYDPALYDQIDDQIGVNQGITVTWADGSTYAFWGWPKNFEPDEITVGSPATGTVGFCVSNVNPTTGAEELPVFTNVAGT